MIGWVGGFPELYAQAGGTDRIGPLKSLLSLFNDRYTPLICMSMFWGWGLGLGQSQYTWSGAVRPQSTQRPVDGAGVPDPAGLLYFALVHIGLAARVLATQSPEVASSDEIIVHLMNNELYSVWSGFFLFSVIGACVSTANSQLLLIASSFSYDIIRTVSPKEVSERQVLNLGRLAVFGRHHLHAAGPEPAGVYAVLWRRRVGRREHPALSRHLRNSAVPPGYQAGVWASVLVGARLF